MKLINRIVIICTVLLFLGACGNTKFSKQKFTNLKHTKVEFKELNAPKTEKIQTPDFEEYNALETADESINEEINLIGSNSTLETPVEDSFGKENSEFISFAEAAMVNKSEEVPAELILDDEKTSNEIPWYFWLSLFFFCTGVGFLIVGWILFLTFLINSFSLGLILTLLGIAAGIFLIFMLLDLCGVEVGFFGSISAKLFTYAIAPVAIIGLILLFFLIFG